MAYPERRISSSLYSGLGWQNKLPTTLNFDKFGVCGMFWNLETDTLTGISTVLMSGKDYPLSHIVGDCKFLPFPL